MGESKITATPESLPGGGTRHVFDKSVTMNSGDTLDMTWTITPGGVQCEYIVRDAPQPEARRVEYPFHKLAEIVDEFGVMLQVETHAHRGGLVISVGDEYDADAVILKPEQEEQLLAILLQRKAEREETNG